MPQITCKRLLKGPELVPVLLLVSAQQDWREDRGGWNLELGGRRKGRNRKGVSLGKTYTWKGVQSELPRAPLDTPTSLWLNTKPRG